ncbi:unnamed protein product [Symbiodinium sp. CCMP2456]|nr:unnamed protein product [Symbiodinium sp. CCMP2456]
MLEPATWHGNAVPKSKCGARSNSLSSLGRGSCEPRAPRLSLLIRRDAGLEDPPRTSEGIDHILQTMEVAWRQVNTARGSTVKLANPEHNLLVSLECARDFMLGLLTEPDPGRQRLAEIFGGDCSRIARVRAILDGATLSHRNCTDDRISSCMSAVKSVEAVLKKDCGVGRRLSEAQQKELTRLRERQSRPCVLFARGNCQAGWDCLYCHHAEHRDVFRPEKRLRKKLQQVNVPGRLLLLRNCLEIKAARLPRELPSIQALRDVIEDAWAIADQHAATDVRSIQRQLSALPISALLGHQVIGPRSDENCQLEMIETWNSNRKRRDRAGRRNTRQFCDMLTSQHIEVGSTDWDDTVKDGAVSTTSDTPRAQSLDKPRSFESASGKSARVHLDSLGMEDVTLESPLLGEVGEQSAEGDPGANPAPAHLDFVPSHSGVAETTAAADETGGSLSTESNDRPAPGSFKQTPECDSLQPLLPAESDADRRQVGQARHFQSRYGVDMSEGMFSSLACNTHILFRQTCAKGRPTFSPHLIFPFILLLLKNSFLCPEDVAMEAGAPNAETGQSQSETPSTWVEDEPDAVAVGSTDWDDTVKDGAVSTTSDTPRAQSLDKPRSFESASGKSARVHLDSLGMADVTLESPLLGEVGEQSAEGDPGAIPAPAHLDFVPSHSRVADTTAAAEETGGSLSTEKLGPQEADSCLSR